MLYTDGVTEGRRGAEFNDLDRLRHGAQQGSPDSAALAGRLVDDAVAFQGGTTRDDIAVVVVRACELVG